MARNKMWDAPDIVPTITYTDLPRAIESSGCNARLVFASAWRRA